MYWDPFDEIDRMHEEMDRVFGRMLDDRHLIGHKGHDVALRDKKRAPVCHLHETENNMIATFEIPGVEKGDIELIVDDDYMELKVESKDKKEKGSKEKGNYSYSSYQTSFYRRIALPKEVDSDKATAEYNQGVLRVQAPKKVKSGKGKKIDVK